jgi:type II secretory pathway component HofQ
VYNHSMLTALFIASLTIAADPRPADIREHAARTGLINIDVKDADVRNVLRLFADVGNVSIAMGDDVKGRVTVKLTQVEWREAMAAVMMQKSLGMERVGPVIVIDTIERLTDRAERRAKIIELKQQSAPLETVLIPINYADANELAPIVRSLLTPRGTVVVDKRSNTLIVTDVRAGEVRERLRL